MVGPGGQTHLLRTQPRAWPLHRVTTSLPSFTVVSGVPPTVWGAQEGTDFGVRGPRPVVDVREPRGQAPYTGQDTATSSAELL